MPLLYAPVTPTEKQITELAEVILGTYLGQSTEEYGRLEEVLNTVSKLFNFSESLVDLVTAELKRQNADDIEKFFS